MGRIKTYAALKFNRGMRATIWSFLSVVVLSGLHAFSVHAFEPSAQQIAAIQAMSPEQRQALAKQYGFEVPQASLSHAQSVNVPTVSVGPRSDQAQERYPASNDRLSNTSSHDADKSSDALTLFGYDLFAGEPTTFAPVNDIPVSSDYELGFGDTLRVTLYGKQSGEYELAINAQGEAFVPELGPIALAGRSFSEAQDSILDMVSRRMIGVKASVAMGKLRSIRVFVLGDAYAPGSYVVSSLSTITNALLLSGGVSKTGSLRHIQLKRDGEVVSELDLYDLLLNGDNRGDLTLRSGDVVFIPPVGSRVSVVGEVLRPAIYEIKQGEVLGDLVRYAGGLTAEAYSTSVTLERVDENLDRMIENFDLERSGEKSLRSGDLLRVPSLLNRLDRVVSLKGHVYRPGVFSWQPGMTLSDLLHSNTLVRPGADFRYGLIKRYAKTTGRLRVEYYSPARVLSGAPDSDIRLSERDEVYVFGLFSGQSKAATDSGQGNFVDQTSATVDEQVVSSKIVSSSISSEQVSSNASSRRQVIDATIEELRAQAEIGAPSNEVEVTGSVRFPGLYPMVPGMTAEDLLEAAGGLTEKAYILTAEVNRTSYTDSREKVQTRLELDLSSDTGLGFMLASRDVLQVRVTPEWSENAFVELQGEVRFPGRYPIHKGDTLRKVIERAGGVTAYAYAPGAVFTRESLQKQEEIRLEEMRSRLSEDIAKAQLVSKDDKGIGQDVSTAQQLLAQLNKTPAIGRLVIDLEKVIHSDPYYQVVLEDGDRLVVPPKRNSVTVIGEVQHPVSQLYQPDMDHWDYIANSGGTTNSADEERIYVIKANGKVVLPEESRWFASRNFSISPGDTVVVPLDADKVDQVVLWRDVSQIFYQIALGAVAVGSL